MQSPLLCSAKNLSFKQLVRDLQGTLHSDFELLLFTAKSHSVTLSGSGKNELKDQCADADTIRRTSCVSQ